MAPDLTKKETKKMAKSLNVVARHLGISRSVEPKKWLMIWGAGLGLGTPKALLYHFLSPVPSEIRYYVGKPFCTARFSSSVLATATKSERNGLEFHYKQPLYLDFCAQVPPPEDTFVLQAFKTPWPEGLTLLKDFISEAEEKELLQNLFPSPTEENENENLKIAKYIPNLENKLKHRLVRHFGYDFRYDTNSVDVGGSKAEDIPSYMVKFITRMMSHNVIFRKPDQITMNHYLPGQGIPPHVDAHSAFLQPIISLSMGAPVLMDFRDGEKQLSLMLPPRSLLVMNEETRYLWTHGIANRKYDVVLDTSKMKFGVDVLPRGIRVSLTFRLLNSAQVCDCRFPTMCDTQQARLTGEVAPAIEKNLVHKVYDDIAQHFSDTRHTPWPGVKGFLDKIAKGQSLLDVGCGNGKYFNLTDYVYEVGMDMSKALLKIAQQQKGVDGVRANCLQIPFKDDSFDAVICIAVLHHLATKERRLQALREIHRVLNTGGHGLIYVWAKDQRLKEVKSAYARQQALRADQDPDDQRLLCPPKDYSFLPVHLHEENFRFNDMLVPWLTNTSKKAEVHHRFYHVFNRGELEDLIAELQPAPRIVDSYYDQGNWCVEIRKDHIDFDVNYHPTDTLQTPEVDD